MFFCYYSSKYFYFYRYPLHFAAMKGDIDILRALLAAKAEVNKQDWDISLLLTM